MRNGSLRPEGELGAAAFRHPYPFAIPTPCAVEDAGVVAELAPHEDAEARVGAAAMPDVVGRFADDGAVIIRWVGAGHRTRSDDELRATSAIDPDPAARIAPVFPFHAGVLAELPADVHAI